MIGTCTGICCGASSYSWDIRWLWERRPLWDIAVIAFSLGGLALSVTGVITGIRHFRNEARSRERRALALRRRAGGDGAQGAVGRSVAK